MIRSQVVVLQVMYDDASDDWPGAMTKNEPAEWNWSDLVDEPISHAVQVMAAGPVLDYPQMVLDSQDRENPS